MTSIALLHYRKHPKNFRKAYPFAAVAKMEGIPFYYFSFDQVNFAEKKINGWVYEKGEWVQQELDFPSVVINSCSPQNGRHKTVFMELKKHVIFTSFPVGNKWRVYRKLLAGKKFASNLIPSFQLQEAEEFISFVKENNKAAMKPLQGRQGKDVFFVKYEQSGFELIDGSTRSPLSYSQLITFVSNKISEQKFLYQPFIESKTRNGLVFDFRLHVQKNGSGDWEITSIYPRISGGSKMISNISGGGYRGELSTFLIEEFGADADQINEMLEHFALEFSRHFDSLYKHSFDELGIDIGMDNQRKFWIFEVNWRPGSKRREFEVARRLIPYCNYLAGKKD